MENTEQNSKVAKSFEKNMNKVIALLKGAKVELPTKVRKDSVSEIVAELFREETEAAEKSVKEELKSLLKKHVEAKRAIESKKKELEALETQKQKEFNEAAVKLFSKIEGVDILEKEYLDSLTQAASAE